jgi:hypothetical protein
MATVNVNSLLQWEELEELEIRLYERNRMLKESEEIPLENESDCDWDDIVYTENDI